MNEAIITAHWSQPTERRPSLKHAINMWLLKMDNKGWWIFWSDTPPSPQHLSICTILQFETDFTKFTTKLK